jgi:hypothetical protein
VTSVDDEYAIKAKDYRPRAADLRTIAQGVTEPSRKVLLLCAEDYERIAETIENIVVHVRQKASVQ